MLCLQAKIFYKSPLVQARLRRTKKTLPWLPKEPAEHRVPLVCVEPPHKYPEKKPCFDISKVLVERGGPCHEKLIRSFLYTHYWPREPSIVSVYMPLDSPYLSCLSERYCSTGDRWLASEIEPRTKERKIVGLLVADKTFPWVADEYERWAHQCCLKPERHNMYFRAHCQRSANLFNRFHIPYAYNIEVLATSSEVTGHNVALLLLRSAIMHALEQRHPLIQIYSKNHYTNNVCARCGMKRDWEMKYTEFIDMKGQKVFYPRRPHDSVVLFIREFDQMESTVPEACFYPDIFELYRKQVLEKEIVIPAEKRCNTVFPLFPDCKT